MALPVINPGICKHDIHYIMIFFVCQKGCTGFCFWTDSNYAPHLKGVLNGDVFKTKTTSCVPVHRKFYLLTYFKWSERNLFEICCCG